MSRDKNLPIGSGDFSIGGHLWPGLSKLVEEAGEVGELLPILLLQRAIGRTEQLAGKLIGSEGSTDHWSGDLSVKLVEELGDLLAAIDFFIGSNESSLDIFDIDARRREKLAKFRGWHRDRLEKRP